MPARNRVPSFQIASGTTAERDNSYNIPTGSIFYNTDTSNIELSGNVVFSEPPECSTAPTSNDQLANKSYVDTKTANMMTTDTTQTITASQTTSDGYKKVKTFGDITREFTHTKSAVYINDVLFLGGSVQNSGIYNGGKLYMTTLDSEIHLNGKMGIGTTTPSYPLDIQSEIALGSTASYGYLRQNSSPVSYSGGWSSYGVSLYTYGLIVSRRYVLASDKRIKRDITDLSNILPLVEQIKPKKYKYKDPKQGDREELGFIAQQVEEILPCAVDTMRDKIPNILQPADVSNQIFTLKEATDLQEGDDLHIYDEDDTAHEVKITEVIDNKSFKTNISTKEAKDKYFIYGKFVDDFKTIEHKCLIPVLMKAVQELNEKVKTLESQIKTQ